MNQYTFKISQTEDGWVYIAFGPINYTSHPFLTKNEAYTRACALNYTPLKGAYTEAK